MLGSRRGRSTPPVFKRNSNLADPHIKPEMDWLDYLSVILYRLGFVLAAPFRSALAMGHALSCGEDDLRCGDHVRQLHAYLPEARAGGGAPLAGRPLWGGLGPVPWLGFESFRARRRADHPRRSVLQGIFLFPGAGIAGRNRCFWPGSGLHGCLILWWWRRDLPPCRRYSFSSFSIAKWRMPLHFDIGDQEQIRRVRGLRCRAALAALHEAFPQLT